MSKADEMLREFLSAPKPDWMIPVDVCAMAQLILLGNDPYPGHEAMGIRCASRDQFGKAVLRALKKLEAAGWAYKHGGGYRAARDFMEKNPKAFHPKEETK